MNVRSKFSEVDFLTAASAAGTVISSGSSIEGRITSPNTISVSGSVKGEINEIEAKNNTTFKIKLKHLLQKHATNLKRGDDDTEFKLTLKHLLDKHVVKGGEEKAD